MLPHLFEYTYFSLFVAYQRKLGPGRLTAEVSRSHTDTHTQTHAHAHTHTHTHKTGITALND